MPLEVYFSQVKRRSQVWEVWPAEEVFQSGGISQAGGVSHSGGVWPQARREATSMRSVTSWRSLAVRRSLISPRSLAYRRKIANIRSLASWRSSLAGRSLLSRRNLTSRSHACRILVLLVCEVVQTYRLTLLLPYSVPELDGQSGNNTLSCIQLCFLVLCLFCWIVLHLSPMQEVPSVVVKILSLIFKQHLHYRPKTTIKSMLVVLFT